jgi:hypothetical protein
MLIPKKKTKGIIVTPDNVQKVFNKAVKRLSHKEKGFISDIAKGETGVQAVLNNYDTEDYHTAGAIASENLKKPRIIQALADAFPDELLQKKHLELMNASRLDHMVFPTGPRNESEKESYIAKDKQKAITEGKEYREIEHITDDDIRDMLESVNCTVRRIVHRDTARDVYFWSADNMARDKALDKAYKIRGSYAAEKIAGPNGEPLFTNEHKEKSKQAITGFLARRNTR